MKFRGNFAHTLDERGRVAIPAKYRMHFGVRAVVTPTPEGCLQVFPEPEFDKLTEDVAKVSATTIEGRRLRRATLADAFDAELDRQGRILVPANLRTHAALDGPVVVVGADEYLELWNPERWAGERDKSHGTSSDGQRSEE